MGQIEKFIDDIDFEGTSAAYLRQQVKLSLKALAALEKLGADVEGQALLAMGAAISKRIKELRGE